MTMVVKSDRYAKEGMSIQVTSKKPVMMVEVSNIPKDYRQNGWRDGMVIVGLSPDATFAFSFTTFNKACAVIPSIRGINPISGLKAFGDILRYGRGTSCPADASHGLLKKEGYCSKCNHHWPSSNYLTVRGSATLDGWRVGKNEIRSFVSLSDSGKDVAENMIPGEAVSSVGFVIYESSQPLGLLYSTPSYLLKDSFLRSVGRTQDYEPQVTWTCCNSVGVHSKGFHDTVPAAYGSSVQDKFIGAGEAAVKIDDPAQVLDPETLNDRPLFSVFMKIVDYTELENLIKTINSKITAGPFKGIPVG